MYDHIWTEMADKIMDDYEHLIKMTPEQLALVLKEAFGNDRIADTWVIDDVQEWASEEHGVEIPDEDARVILHDALRNMDAEIGINWYVFDWPILRWMEEHGLPKEGNDDTDF
jgi:hypothetical protein